MAKKGSMLKLSATLAALLAAFSLSGCIGETLELGKASDFEIKDIYGSTFSLGQITEGRSIAIINLMSVACHGEIDERNEKTFDAIAALLDERGDFAAASIALSACDSSDMQAIAKEHGVTWRFANDYPDMTVFGEKPYSELYSRFGSPTILLVTSDMRIRHASGYLTQDELETAIEKALAGSGDAFIESGTPAILTMLGLGIATSISPCSLVLLIAILAYVGDLVRKKHAGDKKDGAGIRYGAYLGLAFTAGMALVFFLIGCLASYLGFFVSNSALFTLIAGCVLILLGINIIFPFSLMLEPVFSRLRKNSAKTGSEREDTKERLLKSRFVQASPIFGTFVLGILFTLAWAPCAISLVMPVVVMIMTQGVSVLYGGLLFFVFGIGHGVPVVPLSMATSKVRARMAGIMAKWGKWLNYRFGGLVTLFGILMGLRYFGIYLW
ncbi:MAG: hypothetical protein CVT48_03785 [Thermoplasmata archaeon HGW-Thermoplasmata-1]|nr:MAG: hypothetical protein CVT48_03785 [Thermoplasmata archaeon HGW-Thermoplasmata-1]